MLLEVVIDIYLLISSSGQTMICLLLIEVKLYLLIMSSILLITEYCQVDWNTNVELLAWFLIGFNLKEHIQCATAMTYQIHYEYIKLRINQIHYGQSWTEH